MSSQKGLRTAFLHREPGMLPANRRTGYSGSGRAFQGLPQGYIGFRMILAGVRPTYPLSAAFLWDLALWGFNMTLCLSCLSLSTESEHGVGKGKLLSKPRAHLRSLHWQAPLYVLTPHFFTLATLEGECRLRGRWQVTQQEKQRQCHTLRRLSFVDSLQPVPACLVLIRARLGE